MKRQWYPVSHGRKLRVVFLDKVAAIFNAASGESLVFKRSCSCF
jgi:hypothetical protein